jgi:hypothetical protein
MYEDYTQADYEADTAGGRYADAAERCAYQAYGYELLASEEDKPF